MISFFDVIDRAMTGPHCPESDFEMKVLYPKIQEVVGKYSIQYDPDNPIPADDDLADRVFNAGFDLYQEVGLYCPDTERIMKFSKQELLDALNDAPSRSVLGEGKDTAILRGRKPESDDPPFCWIGSLGAAVSTEELYASIMEAYGLWLPLANGITAPSLTTINGRTVRTGTPLEVMAAIRVTAMGREALRRSGRPGLAIMNNIATAGSDVAKIAGSQFGLRPTDSWVMGHTAEFKLGFHRLNEIAFVEPLGGIIIGETAPILGGFCGGPEGTAVANAAYHLSAIIAGRADAQLTFPTHFKLGCTSPRQAIWAKSVSVQAMTRNSHLPVFVDHYAAAGAMTDMFFYEAAADNISTVASGGHITSAGVAKATKVDHFTPFEPKFSSEVAHAVPGMKRSEANQIVKKLLDKYESRLGNPPVGKKYEECWDTQRNVPNEEYVNFYENIKKKISDIGIPLKK